MLMSNINRNYDLQNRIRGSLFGGAVGDALGYAVEFSSEKEIFSKYGENGIVEYELNPVSGKALISDDTQMTLFTANGLLIGDTRGKTRGIMGYPRSYVAYAYQDWYLTQIASFESVNAHERFEAGSGQTWLLDVPELFNRRAPGNTCLAALSQGMSGHGELTKEHRVNQSKGCGGVMRIAPVALMYRPGENYYGSMESLDLEAAEIAAITHGHSLGFMSASVISHIITNVLTKPEMSLKENVLDARDTVAGIFPKYHHINELTEIIDRAMALSENSCSDLENIHSLGEGWVAEETMAIAIYCALRYENDFSKAVITAVNHSGDSDSTGAVTGNIVGAIAGYDAIENKWKEKLELSDVILEMADDLYSGCTMDEYGGSFDLKWNRKYIEMHRYSETKPSEMPVFFWKEDEENGEFSNWYRRKFVIDDFEYFCAEQYMMAEKAKLFHDSTRYTAILQANTPKACKDLGKQVTPFDGDRWKAVRFEVVKKANRAKYEQNPDLKEKLMATGDRILAEASPYDKIWGIGLKAKDAEKTEPDKWPGKNLLGKVLMEIREEFKTEKNSQITE